MTLETGSLAGFFFSVTSAMVCSHQKSRVWQMEDSFEISLDFMASRKRAWTP
jgi:hypothetical protein